VGAEPAVAAELRRASNDPISARHRRTMAAALRPAVAAAARPTGRDEGPPTADPAAAARWSAPAPVRALSATSRKTTNCALAWPARPRPAPVPPARRHAGARGWRPHPAMAAKPKVRQARRVRRRRHLAQPPGCTGSRRRRVSATDPAEAPAARRPRHAAERRPRQADARCSAVPGRPSRARP